MPSPRTPRKPSRRTPKPPAAAPAPTTRKARVPAPASTGRRTPGRRKREPLRVGCVYLMVGDMGRALDFYTHGLGLGLLVRYDDEWAEIEAGDVRLGLHPTDGAVKGDGGATVSFYVTDLDATATRVREAGGTMGAIHNTPRGRMSMGRDTEGNGLHFSEFDPKWVRQAKYPLQKWARRGS